MGCQVSFSTLRGTLELLTHEIVTLKHAAASGIKSACPQSRTFSMVLPIALLTQLGPEVIGSEPGQARDQELKCIRTSQQKERGR